MRAGGGRGRGSREGEVEGARLRVRVRVSSVWVFLKILHSGNRAIKSTLTANGCLNKSCNITDLSFMVRVNQ